MKQKLTVGSLRGIPQWASNAAPSHPPASTVGGRLRPEAPPQARSNVGVPHPAPVHLGRGCCRSMCFGCPWADMMRRMSGRDARPRRVRPPEEVPPPAAADQSGR